MWRFSGRGSEIAIQASGSLRVNNGQALRAAALAHVGVILQPEILMADDIAAGRLIHLLADHAAPSLPLSLLTLPDRHPSPKLRSFIDLVVKMV